MWEKTKRKLENLYMDFLWKDKFYSVKDVRRKYGLEYREVVKYLLPFVEVRKKENLL
jgi:hypothetical protein